MGTHNFYPPPCVYTRGWDQKFWFCHCVQRPCASGCLPSKAGNKAPGSLSHPLRPASHVLWRPGDALSATAADTAAQLCSPLLWAGTPATAPAGPRDRPSDPRPVGEKAPQCPGGCARRAGHTAGEGRPLQLLTSAGSPGQRRPLTAHARSHKKRYKRVFLLIKEHANSVQTLMPLND